MSSSPTFRILEVFLSHLKLNLQIPFLIHRDRNVLEIPVHAALATAILDRLAYQCDKIPMNGKSYRLENRKSFLEETA